MRIDIFYDLVCPWCFIGKHRLECALAERPGLRVELRWQPFQLNPAMPRQGMPRGAYLAAKFGGPERAAQIYAVVGEAAAREGLRLALERIERTPNTLDAHRLVRHVTASGGSAAAATEALFRAYFQEGRDIGDPAILAQIGGALGLDAGSVRAYLASEADTAAVAAADAAARQMGIQAVPCFVFDRRYALSGAQEPAAFFPLFDLAETALP